MSGVLGRPAQPALGTHPEALFFSFPGSRSRSGQGAVKALGRASHVFVPTGRQARGEFSTNLEVPLRFVAAARH